MRFRLALLPSILLLASSAAAHDDATLDRMPSPHGGQVRMAGPFHFELVLESERVVLHVMDHANQSVPVEGARASAKLVTVDGEETVELLPIAETALGRNGELEPAPGSKVEVTISMPGQRPWTVTFTPSKEVPPPPR